MKRNRVRLRFDRNKDMRTEYYLIYRSNSKGVNRRDPLIMKVKHSKFVNPLIMKGDTAYRLQSNIYQLGHAGILSDQPFTVYIDGVVASPTLYSVNFEQGMIVFNQHLLDTAVVIADYTFDGIEVIDDGISQEWIREYYGPPAEDITNPSAPTNLSMIVDNTNGSVVLNYKESATGGQNYYYCIEARGTEQNYSSLSPEYVAYLKANISEYQIEASTDGGTKWLAIGSTELLTWSDKDVDKEAPEPLQNGTAEVTPKQNTGKADIKFSWTTPLLNNKSSYTPKYRVRAKTDAGVLSTESLPVGPDLIKSNIDRIVIRRKISDGIAWPSFDGSDAVTVAVIEDTTIGSYTDEVDDNTVYAYSLYVVDEAGNISPATTYEIAVDKTAAPMQIAGITVTAFNIIV